MIIWENLIEFKSKDINLLQFITFKLEISSKYMIMLGHMITEMASSHKISNPVQQFGPF